MLGHSASSLSREEYTHPNHGQPVSAGGCCGNSVKGLSKGQVDDIHSLSLIHYAIQLVIEEDQVGPAGLALHEAMLAGPDPLVVLQTPSEHTQDEPLHNL